MKKALFLLLAFAFVTFVGISSALAQGAAQSSQKPAATQKAAPARVASGVLARAETLSGTITTVVPKQNLLIMTDSRGVPFDFVVRPGAKVTVSGKRSNLADLASDANRSVSVRFVPMVSGDIARSVEVSG